MIDGVLAFVCCHSVPRVVKYPDGFFLLHNGNKVQFDSLVPIDEVRTDRFGWLRNYTIPRG